MADDDLRITTEMHWHAHPVYDLCFTRDGKFIVHRSIIIFVTFDETQHPNEFVLNLLQVISGFLIEKVFKGGGGGGGEGVKDHRPFCKQ